MKFFFLLLPFCIFLSLSSCYSPGKIEALRRVSTEADSILKETDNLSLTIINHAEKKILQLQTDSSALSIDTAVLLSGYIKNFEKDILAKVELSISNHLAKKSTLRKKGGELRLQLPAEFDSAFIDLTKIKFRKNISNVYYSIQGDLMSRNQGKIEFLAESDPIPILILFVAAYFAEKSISTSHNYSGATCVSDCETLVKQLGLRAKCVPVYKNKQTGPITCVRVSKR